MITNLRIQNFKSWQDTGNIPLAPITLLFGKNSAGKSSITQFLMMLKQTAESPDRQRVFHFGDRKSLLDLGTYKDIVHKHDTSKGIEFAISWKPEADIVVKEAGGSTKFSGNEMTFDGRIKYDNDGGLYVDQFNYKLKSDPELTVDFARKDERDSKKGVSYKLEAKPYELKRNTGRAWQLGKPVRFYGFPDEAIGYYQNSGFVSDFVLSLEKELKKISYLGPLRDYPTRDYSASGEAPIDVGVRGDRSVEALVYSKDREISPGRKRQKKMLEHIIGEWLKKLGLIVGFSIQPITENKKQYEVRLKIADHSPEVNLADVGFGISQVLPVVTSCFYAQPSSTLILEQPEIHLHPQAQKGLADLFIDAVNAREKGKDRKIQLVIESHSEHLLLRLQRRIAEKKIKPEQVAIYYIVQDKNGSQLKALGVNLSGEITNWPDDFFGNEMDDLYGRIVAAQK